MKFEVGDKVEITFEEGMVYSENCPHHHGEVGEVINILPHNRCYQVRSYKGDWYYGGHRLKLVSLREDAVSGIDMTKGLRFNKGKIDYTQLSPIGQEMEARVYMYGAMKYFRDNFKNGKDTFEEAAQEFLECAMRHMIAYRKGEWYDKESKLPHLTHAVWNMNRIMDFYYYGMNHMKDGKELYQQPNLKEDELPPIPTEDNFFDVWGMKTFKQKQKEKEDEGAEE